MNNNIALFKALNVDVSLPNERISGREIIRLFNLYASDKTIMKYLWPLKDNDTTLFGVFFNGVPSSRVEASDYYNKVKLLGTASKLMSINIIHPYDAFKIALQQKFDEENGANSVEVTDKAMLIIYNQLKDCDLVSDWVWVCKI